MIRRRFRRPGLASPAEDHPEPRRAQQPAGAGLFRLPPPEFRPPWNAQHGIHDPESDPCGSGPIDARDAATKRGAQ